MNQHYFDIPFAFSGDVTAIPDPLQTGGTVSFTEGWNYNYQRNLSTDPAALPIDRSTTNWLFKQITMALQALQQQGVPEFILSSQNGGAAYSYGKGAVVLWSASGNAPFVKYVNLTAGNTSVPSASDPLGATTGWQVVCDPIASSAMAAAGTDNASIMTPLLVAQQTALRALLAGNATQVFNVGPATSATHAPETSQVQQNAFNYAGVAGGTANALTATLAPAPTAYTDDLTIIVRIAFNNTGATTFQLGSLAALPIVGAAHSAMQGGELVAGGFACFAYSSNLAKFVLLWATGGAEQVGNASQSQHAVPLAQIQGMITNMQVVTSNGTFTVPASVTKIKYRAVGGGGGGGSSSIAKGCAGGAGAGAYSEGTLTVTPGANLTITVGSFGVQGTGGGAGTAGGTTSITGAGISVSCPGGNPSGGITTANTVGASGQGGAVASVSGANVIAALNAPGGAGQIGSCDGTGGSYFGGNGAFSAFGGPLGGNGGYPGAAFGAYGSAGSGGANNNYGGNGSPGVVVFEW